MSGRWSVYLCFLFVIVPDPDLEDGGAGEVAELCRGHCQGGGHRGVGRLKQLPDGLHSSDLVCVIVLLGCDVMDYCNDMTVSKF